MSDNDISEGRHLEENVENGPWDITIYVLLSISIVFGLSMLITLCVGLCKYFRRPTPEQPPPSPVCKRQVSIHAQYPPTPHITRFPKVRRGLSRNSSFKMSFNLAKRFQNRASWKMGSITSPAKKFRTFSTSRRSSAGNVTITPSGSVSNISVASVVIPMPDQDISSVNNKTPQPSTA